MKKIDIINWILKKINYAARTKNFVVTGIPRSGTSLLAKIINDSEKYVCLNETFYNTNYLSWYFWMIKKKIKLGEEIPKRIDNEGEISTDTLSEGTKIRREVEKVEGSYALGVKVNIPYLNEIDYIIELDIPIFAIVRNPVFTLLSWNSDKAVNIPEQKLNSKHINERYKDIDFFTRDKFEMQAQIWEHYCSLLWEKRSKINILTYENMSSYKYNIFSKLEKELGLKNEKISEKIENMNKKSRYKQEDINGVKNAVKRFCPSRSKFGYE